MNKNATFDFNTRITGMIIINDIEVVNITAEIPSVFETINREMEKISIDKDDRVKIKLTQP